MKDLATESSPSVREFVEQRELFLDAFDRLYYPFNYDRMDILSKALGLYNDMDVIRTFLNLKPSEDMLTQILRRQENEKEIFDASNVRVVLRVEGLYSTDREIRQAERFEYWLMGEPTSLEYKLYVPNKKLRGMMLSSSFVTRSILLKRND